MANTSLKGLHAFMNDTVSKRGTMIKMRHMRMRIQNLALLRLWPSASEAVKTATKTLKSGMDPKLSAKVCLCDQITQKALHTKVGYDPTVTYTY